jgi:hypothetical protein
MNIAPSTAENLPLPGWAYVPGETAEAEADHDTLRKAKALCRRNSSAMCRPVIPRFATG